MQTEDGQIIYQCLNGDPAMFGVLVDKYREGIYALAYSKIGNFHDAQDITQEAFIKAFRKLHTLKHWETFALWLSAIVNNLCKDFIRARAKRPDRDFVEDQSLDLVDHTSINSYHNDLVHKSLQEALNSLPEIYRQVIALHYLSGYKSMDIAKLLGVSLRTVTERLKIGRERLKEEMIAMMSETFKEQRLPAGFTFRVVEIVKRIKIQPVSTMKGLPWGLSLATGIIIAVLSLNPYIPQLDQFGTISGAPLLSESKVLKVGEIPVDVVKTSNLPILSSKIGKGKSGEPKQPDMQNALFMSPKAEGGEWQKKSNMPTARYCLGTATLDGKIYAIGGTHSPDGAGLSAIEEYDSTTDVWKQKSDMPTARVGLSIEAVNGKIYAIGGYLNWTSNALPTVEEYDPVGDKWTTKADMPTPRGFFGTAVLNNKIFAIGGDSGNVNLSTVEVYDPSSNTWEKKKDMIAARSFFGAKAVNGKIYAIGGRIMPSIVGLSTVEEYDPLLDKWEQKSDIPDLPKGIFEHAISEVSGKIYVIGGCDGGDYFLTTREYDPVTDRWEKKSDMLAQRISPLSATAVNEKIYVIGGANPDGQGPDNWLSTVEEYTPEGWQSAVSPQNKLPKTWGNLKSR